MRAQYTSPLVAVNKPDCYEANKPPCKFTDMARKKKAKKRAGTQGGGELRRPTTPFGVRLYEAMILRECHQEADLVKKIHELFPGDDWEEFRTRSLTQQMVNHILRDKAQRSYFTPILAAALDVSCLWMAFGVGGASAKQLDAVGRPVTAAGTNDRRKAG